MRLLLLGASGAVGSAVLQLALENPSVDQVIAPTRNRLSIEHAKLENPLWEVDHVLAQAETAVQTKTQPIWWRADAAICALGSTIKKAGSPAAFAKIDLELVRACGVLAKQHGVQRFVTISSLGASPQGNFYLRIKAAAESALQALNFDSLSILRPSFIDAQRNEARPLESIALALFRAAKPIIPKRFRAVRATDIAKCALEHALGQALDQQSGLNIIESEQI